MTAVEKLLGSLGIDQSIVCEFFILFSRFEYALKRAGYAQQSGRQITIEWKRFAKTLESKFDHSAAPSLTKSCDYITERPPKTQRIDSSGKLSWVETEKRACDLELVRLVRLVQTVRNNLFHGGKFPGSREDEVSRDKELIQSSITILESILELDSNVNRLFHELA